MVTGVLFIPAFAGTLSVLDGTASCDATSRTSALVGSGSGEAWTTGGSCATLSRSTCSLLAAAADSEIEAEEEEAAGSLDVASAATDTDPRRPAAIFAARAAANEGARCGGGRLSSAAALESTVLDGAFPVSTGPASDVAFGATTTASLIGVFAPSTAAATASEFVFARRATNEGGFPFPIANDDDRAPSFGRGTVALVSVGCGAALRVASETEAALGISVLDSEPLSELTVVSPSTGAASESILLC